MDDTSQKVDETGTPSAPQQVGGSTPTGPQKGEQPGGEQPGTDGMTKTTTRTPQQPGTDSPQT